MTDDRLKQVAEAVAELADHSRRGIAALDQRVAPLEVMTIGRVSADNLLRIRNSMRALAAGDAPTIIACEECGAIVNPQEGGDDDETDSNGAGPTVSSERGSRASADGHVAPPAKGGDAQPRPADSLAEEMERMAEAHLQAGHSPVGMPERERRWASCVRALQAERDEAVKRAEAAEASLRAIDEHRSLDWLMPLMEQGLVMCTECCSKDRERGCDHHYRPECPHCHGEGWVKSEPLQAAEAKAAELEAAEPADCVLVTREMWEAAKRLNPHWLIFGPDDPGRELPQPSAVRAALGVHEKWVQPETEEAS